MGQGGGVRGGVRGRGKEVGWKDMPTTHPLMMLNTAFRSSTEELLLHVLVFRGEREREREREREMMSWDFPRLDSHDGQDPSPCRLQIFHIVCSNEGHVLPIHLLRQNPCTHKQKTNFQVGLAG